MHCRLAVLQDLYLLPKVFESVALPLLLVPMTTGDHGVLCNSFHNNNFYVSSEGVLWST